MNSNGRILTTHVGSLPRPDDLVEIMFAREDGIPIDESALQERVERAVGEAVARQVAAGVDIVNDGEWPKPSYATYIKDRLSGLGGTGTSYVFPLAEAMRHEYEAIVVAGIMLQVDCPDLAMGRHTQYRELSLAEFRERMELHVEALNRAFVNIPAERVRMHLCWGNYPGPHHCDVPFEDIVDEVWKAKPHAVKFEAANPRHAHEWSVFEQVKLRAGKMLIPGVIEVQSNYIEHPDLVAQRIPRCADRVGRDNVMAGTDCGFSIHVGTAGVDPDVLWAKLAALSQGAERASRKLSHRR